MPDRKKIKLYHPAAFTETFMPGKEIQALFNGGLGKFFIVRIEEMYRHVKQMIPPSRGTTHSCIYLTEGIAKMKIGSGEYTVNKDEMLFVPAGQVFSFKEDEVNQGFLCNFHDDILIGRFVKSSLLKDFEYLRVWGNPLVRPDRQTSKYIRHIFLRLLDEYNQNGLGNLDIIQPYLVTLLCEVNRVYQPVSNSDQIAAVMITNKFKGLIYANITRLHQVSDYAALLNISPNHLNKTVKQITGKSPTRWIDEAIVLEAKVLLSRSDMPVNEVALEVGIEDQSYFTRLFKKYEGLTPTAFRKMIEKS